MQLTTDQQIKVLNLLGYSEPADWANQQLSTPVVLVSRDYQQAHYDSILAAINRFDTLATTIDTLVERTAVNVLDDIKVNYVKQLQITMGMQRQQVHLIAQYTGLTIQPNSIHYGQPRPYL